MALRLIEIVLPDENSERVEGLLKEQQLVGIWYEKLSEGQTIVRVLMLAEKTEAVLDILEKNFSMINGFRTIILPVEASIPRPRLRDLADQHLYRISKTEKYPHVEPLLKGTINEKLILDNYDEMLRVAGSQQLGFVTASLFISKLQARPQQNILTRVLQEYGRLEKTIFILRYIQDPVFRRDINLQLTKGEQVHDLRQFLHFANEGKIRSHLEEEQINEASCLNLVVNAIILWNTVYMQEIVKQLRKDGYHINDDDLKHLGPARHEHINPYGNYIFNVQQELQRKGLRPLRTHK